MKNSDSDLMLQIELLRNKMIEVANREGFTQCNTISLSQELDQLLNDYERSIEKGVTIKKKNE